MDEKSKRKIAYYVDALCDLTRIKNRKIHWKQEVDVIRKHYNNQLIDAIVEFFGRDSSGGSLMINGTAYSFRIVNGIIHDAGKALVLGGEVDGSSVVDSIDFLHDKAIWLFNKVEGSILELDKEIIKCQNSLCELMSSVGIDSYRDIDFVTSKNKGTLRYDRNGIRLI